MNKFSAAHLQRGSHASAAHMTRGSHVTGAKPRTPVHGLPAQLTPRKLFFISEFGKPVHGLPAFTDGSIHRQPRACPPSVSSISYRQRVHMFAWLTCWRGSHVSDAEISFGTSVHGLPAYTDADFSEHQCTACPHTLTPIFRNVSAQPARIMTP